MRGGPPGDVSHDGEQEEALLAGWPTREFCGAVGWLVGGMPWGVC